MYNLNDKIGMKQKVDSVSCYQLSVSGTFSVIKSPMGRRDFIRIINNSGTDVLLSDTDTKPDSDAWVINSSGGTFESETNADLYIKSSSGTVNINVYEVKKR